MNGAQTQTPPQHSYLAFTVQPDRSVTVGWNTTTNLPRNSTLPMNITSGFPPGYAIHSTASFSQQSSAVVQTTTTQYTLPQAVIAQSQGILNYVTINLTSTQTGNSGQGSLRIDTIPSAVLPISNVLVSYTNDLSSIDITASAQAHFYSSLTGFLENQTAFQTEWTNTFGNLTWTNSIMSQIQNSTKVFTVTAFTGTLNSINSTSASFSIHLHAVANTITPTGDLVTAFEQRLNFTIPAALDSIIRQLLALSTSQSISLQYTGSTNILTIRTTENYVPDLDAKLNSIKSQLFNYILGNLPSGFTLPPTVSFIQSTDIAVSQMSLTNDLDLNASTDRTSLQGLIIKPPTVGPNNNFTIPGLFQILGLAPQQSLDIKLVGGSNSSYTVKIVVPSGTVQPTSTTTNTATWTSIQNATLLQNVRFELVPTSTNLLDLLTSPTALIIEGIAAVIIIASAVILVKRRRSGLPTPSVVPSPTPGPGPSPTPSPSTP